MIHKRYWLYAILLAVSIHVLGFLLLIERHEEDGAQLPGEQGIEIDLGMLGDLGVAEQETPEPAAEPEAQPEPEPPKPEPEPEPEPEPVPEPEPKPEPKLEPVQPKQQTEVKVKAQPKPEPKPEPVIEPKSEPVPEPVAEPAKPAQKSQSATASTTDSTKRAQRKQSTGHSNSLSSGGQVAARQSYFSILAAKLAKHKSYPSASRRRGEEGVVKLFFVLDRDGNVLDYKITKSSGSRRLDEAVLSMLKKAEPLPAFPDEMTQSKLEVNVPIAFQLNQS